MMAVFAGAATVDGEPLTDLIGTEALPLDRWDEIKEQVAQGGKKIIQLRGRSSFQSPAHQSLVMVKAVMDGQDYPWPAGAYVDGEGFEKTMMAMETTLGPEGVTWRMPRGTDEELAALRASYRHLVKLRDEVIAMGILPPLAEWGTVNSNL